MLVRFVSTEPRQELPNFSFLKKNFLQIIYSVLSISAVWQSDPVIHLSTFSKLLLRGFAFIFAACSFPFYTFHNLYFQMDKQTILLSNSIFANFIPDYCYLYSNKICQFRLFLPRSKYCLHVVNCISQLCLKRKKLKFLLQHTCWIEIHSNFLEFLLWRSGNKSDQES